jgi:hypothetical protein
MSSSPQVSSTWETRLRSSRFSSAYKKYFKFLKFYFLNSVADPGCYSRIPYPDIDPSRIPDLGSWIQQQQQEKGEKLVVLPSVVSTIHKYHKTGN